jgi:hypothetical protein
VKDDGTLDDLYEEWIKIEAPEELDSATHEST